MTDALILAADQEGRQTPRDAWRISLVSPPFNSVRRPSIQLGLLAGIARARGWVATTHHLFLDFAVMVGTEFYEAVANNRGVATGDWLFSPLAFAGAAPDPDGNGLIEAFGRSDGEWLRNVRGNLVPEFVSLAADEIVRARPDVVGFTSTFQQTIAGIAIARRVKELLPHAVMLFGGANFERDMALEWINRVPEIDLILSGEADSSFPALLDVVSSNGDLASVRGLTWRQPPTPASNAALPCQNEAAMPVTDLAANPVPDYSEYFARAAFLGLHTPGLRNDVRLPFESARGCWWGERQHCTFCGLNAATMSFRAKPAERVLEELAEMAQRYGSFHFEAVDNIIARDYAQTLLPRLASLDTTYDLFYEVKANLKPQELGALAAAGVRTIQPGIESLSTPVLKLMRKGVRGLDNLNLLRWAAVHGISVSWNMLWGFPGERREDYDAQARLLPLLHHLQPPSAGVRVWLERFSPLFKDEALFPRRYMRPERSLDFILPATFEKASVAYFFDYEMEGTLPDAAFEETEARLSAWREAWRRPRKPTLSYHSATDLVIVEDGRAEGDAVLYRYDRRDARVFQALIERPLGTGRVAQLLDEPQAHVERSLRLLAMDGVVASEGDLHLALPLPARARC
ncbi:MAG TPA: RiPP maturation radical SAM C-methyltransferase [Roseococcus sp.]|jgi:ribosomal peptide maturation radical SAM protein 1|nr:RiPP maturation radical SAM C-methyltransferase [Roseococcus sp.]